MSLTINKENCTVRIQALFYDILKADTNVTNKTSHIMDGSAPEMYKGSGTYVIIRSPMVKRSRQSGDYSNQKGVGREHIIIFSKTESVARALNDAVVEAIEDARTSGVLGSHNVSKVLINSGEPREELKVSDDISSIWMFDVYIDFEVKLDV